MFDLKALPVLVAAVLTIAAAGARAQHHEVLTLDIKAQNVGSALIALAEISGVQIALSAVSGDNFEVGGLKGEYLFQDALDALLANTGLTHEFISENLVVVKPLAQEAAPPAETAEAAPVGEQDVSI